MKKDILIVEDEIIIANLLKKILEHEGYTILGLITSGEKAVDFARDKKLDIIIMDIHLAGNISGIEAARQIKENKNIDIVFITGFPDIETRNMAYTVNPSGFFIKPLDIFNFISHIKSIE
jgi:DNA-binding response OmpR family regulator